VFSATVRERSRASCHAVVAELHGRPPKYLMRRGDREERTFRARGSRRPERSRITQLGPGLSSRGGFAFLRSRR